jgi:hypothetical protein
MFEALTHPAAYRAPGPDPVRAPLRCLFGGRFFTHPRNHGVNIRFWGGLGGHERITD